MKLTKMLALLALASIFLLALSACGGAPAPLEMSNIPLYSTAKETTDATNVKIADAVTQGMKSSLGDKAKNIETKVYTAGKATTWDAVEKYYNEQMEKGGWTTDPSLTFNDPTVRGKGWVRGSQIAAVFFAADPALPDSLLLIALATVK